MAHVATFEVADSARFRPHTDDELTHVEKPIDLNEARDQVLDVAAEAQPILPQLAGTDSLYNVMIEIHDVTTIGRTGWTGSGPNVRLRFNTRQATFTEVRLRHFVLHEVLGHGLQCSTYADHASRADVDWVRLSSVHLPHQTRLEGLAQSGSTDSFPVVCSD